MTFEFKRTVNGLNPKYFIQTFEPLSNDLLMGLLAEQKRLPPKLFYNEQGSLLFDRICEQPEYYVPKCEKQALKRNLAAGLERFKDISTLIELGGCNPSKAKLLMPYMPALQTYVPIDISKEYLLKAQGRLRVEFPFLQIKPIAADFMREIPLSARIRESKKLFFFPGSSIGNFSPTEVNSFLKRLKSIAGPDDALLVGVDLKKDQLILELAYNDPARVTARFNKNILLVMNDRYGANFNLDKFVHRAFYNARESRIEMHLVSTVNHVVTIDGHEFKFKVGESLHTENSYKYTKHDFQDLARSAGLTLVQCWVDQKEWFSVHLMDMNSATFH